jgi:hypothetical protein
VCGAKGSVVSRAVDIVSITRLDNGIKSPFSYFRRVKN